MGTKGGDLVEGQSKGELRIDGDKLKAIIKRQGMTTHLVAGAMGMHTNGILRIIRTGSTSLSTLEMLCEVLNCNPMDLLVWNQEHFSPVDPNLVALDTLLSRIGIEERVFVLS
jgi:DNA-binding Xre family transcriptional regulator